MKRLLCLVTALCMALALLPCGASAVDIIGEVEKAKKALRSVEKTLTVYNDIMMDEFLSLASKQLTNADQVKLSFDKEADFRRYNASSKKAGSLTVNIRFECEGYVSHDMYTFAIPILTGDAAANNADTEKLAEDRAAVSGVFKNVSFDADVTKEDILAKVRAVVKNGTTIEWKDDFVKVDSTDTKKGSVKGTLELTLNGKKDTVRVFNGLRLAAASAGDNTGTAAPSLTGFNDVVSGAYYEAAVKWAVDNKITTGTSAATFTPDATCTRAQIITFIWRAMGSPKTGAANPFTDVNTTDYFYDAAVWANKLGFTSGTEFAPETPCTRASTVTYLWIAAGSPSADTEAGFSDVAASADYAKAVAWAVEEGITSGVSATEFAPGTICSRGQIVTFLNRTFE